MNKLSPIAVLGLVSSLSIGIGCSKSPAEPEPPKKDPAASSATATTPASTGDKDKGGDKGDKAGVSSAPKSDGEESAASSSLATGGGKTGSDPHKGSFTIQEATKDFPGKGPIVAKIDTSKGAIQCKLFDDKAPTTVANFIGLATGKRAWKHPKDGTWVNKPAYDGTTFHRIIKGFMIQGGDPKGNGTGEPGYTIKDEIWDGAKHDRAGLLCMANRGHNTNGAQFFITDAAAAHLDGNYTIFGDCAPEQIIHDIANTPVSGDRAAEIITIKSVTITRDDAKKKAAAPAATPTGGGNSQ
jgi:peptidyl-prolyl cis-trans isomerase A (cyclophilin A)